MTKYYLGLPLKKKTAKIQFDIHLTEHCNLNCKGCGHFSCVAEPEFVNVNEFKRDMNRVGELFNHECDNIRLLGGEPLLHPDIIELTKIARDSFTKGDIYITTNGILLTQMSNEFWEACHDNNISIRISHYPIKLDEEKIVTLAKKFDVICHVGRENLIDSFQILPIDLSGRENYKKNFSLCYYPTNCTTLKHGRLYSCPFTAHVHLFNKKFDQNIEITDKDYIDIYSDITKDEILKRLTIAIPACRYCRISEHRPTNWEISKRNINEWL